MKTKKLLEERCANAAARIIFQGLTEADLPRFGLQYRKGKTFGDVRKAQKRAIRANTYHKIEHLEEWLALYLADVLKLA